MKNNIPNKKNINSDWLYSDKVEYFNDLLESVNRPGMDKVIEFLKNSDFYTAPASACYHNNYRGGLLDHVLSVYSLAMKYKESMIQMNPGLILNNESIIIISLLHDICKVDFYQPVQKYRKDETGQWETYEGYKVVDTMPCGHGDKSVIMLQYIGLQLTVEEILAIRWHMGLFNDNIGDGLKKSQVNAIKISPYVPLLQIADYTSAFMFETEIEN